MSLKEKIPAMLLHINQHAFNLEFNQKVFEILEGDLAKHVSESLRRQLSESAFKVALQRMAPINILRKIILKLSKLYKDPGPTRTCPNENDLELIRYYENELGINTFWNDHNEGFNAYKNALLEVYEHERAIKVRAVMPNKFIAYSDSLIDPTKETIIIKFMGKIEKKKRSGRGFSNHVVEKFWAYSKDEFIAFDSEGEIILKDMSLNEGVNPYGVIPAVYTNRSRYTLVPTPDTDILAMTVLFPILLTDTNFTSQFLSMPILYGIDIDFNNMQISPNAFWDLKSNPASDKQPQLGVVNPNPDLAGQMNIIKEQLALWLESRNIRAGAIGTLTTENFASGISLMVRDMDTTEDRKVQETYFKDAEKEFWWKLATVHNYLLRNGMIDGIRPFSDPDNLDIEISYAGHDMLEDRAAKIERLQKEVEAAFTSRRSAIEQLHPDKKDIEAYIAEIDGDATLEINAEIDA